MLKLLKMLMIYNILIIDDYLSYDQNIWQELEFPQQLLLLTEEFSYVSQCSSDLTIPLSL